MSNGNKIIQDCLDTQVNRQMRMMIDMQYRLILGYVYYLLAFISKFLMKVFYSNIVEKKELDKTCSPFTTCNSDEVYNQTVFIKHLLDHYKQNPDSEAACMGKNDYFFEKKSTTMIQTC